MHTWCLRVRRRLLRGFINTCLIDLSDFSGLKVRKIGKKKLNVSSLPYVTHDALLQICPIPADPELVTSILSSAYF